MHTPTETLFYYGFRICPVYEDVLPNGYCMKFLKGRRIFQSPKRMKRQDSSIYGCYEEGWKFVELWFGSGRPNKEFIKRWLGKQKILCAGWF